MFRNIRITYPGGGVSIDSPFNGLVDMHEIDIHGNGYWTDDKTIWGIPVASALFARHVKNITFHDMIISHRKPEERPAFAFADSQIIELERIRIDGEKIKPVDMIQQKCTEFIVC